jgi:hypothetical protein
MDFEYTESVRDDISHILGGVEELEELIRHQCSQQPVSVRRRLDTRPPT